MSSAGAGAGAGPVLVLAGWAVLGTAVSLVVTKFRPGGREAVRTPAT